MFVGQGFDYILSSMNAERTLVASEVLGGVRWFLEKDARYVREREVFGRPINTSMILAFVGQKVLGMPRSS